MLRPATTLATVLSAAALVFTALPAAGANPPNPPAGSVSVQPGSADSDGQGGGDVAHCGASASTGGNTYAVQPIQIGPGGTATPSGCGATSSENNAGATNGAGRTTAQGAGAPSGTTGGAQSTGDQMSDRGTLMRTASNSFPNSGVSDSGSGFGLGWLWLGLLLLLALLFLLIGIVVGRRRQQPTHVAA